MDDNIHIFAFLSFPASWSERVREYSSPLFAAVQHGSSWAVRPLLSHGADPGTSYRGRSAQHTYIQQCAFHTIMKKVNHLIELNKHVFIEILNVVNLVLCS